MKKNKRMSIKTLTYGAVLTAVVVILQFLAVGVKAALPLLPFTVSLVLIPIVIGAAKCGPYIGAWLGFVFGVVVLLSGDASAFLVINPFGTILTVLVKGAACGLASGFVYRLIEKKQKIVAVYAAAIVCPIVNTGIFFVGCLLFFMDTVSEWAVAFGFGDNVAAYMFVGLAGFNFLFEFAINLALSPVIIRALNLRSASGGLVAQGVSFTRENVEKKSEEADAAPAQEVAQEDAAEGEKTE